MIARRRTPEQKAREREEAITWPGPARPFTVTFDCTPDAPAVHRSMSPDWARAVELALRAVLADGRLRRGSKVKLITIEEK